MAVVGVGISGVGISSRVGIEASSGKDVFRLSRVYSGGVGE